MNKIHLIFLSISIFLLNILLPVTLWANFNGFYEDPQILNYIEFKIDSLDDGFYSEEDILHMKDVRNLFGIAYLSAFISFIIAASILLISKRKKEILIKALRIASLITFVFLTLIILFITLFSFNTFFTRFHEIFFNNDYWLLDPETSRLIRFFPEELFQKIALLIVSTIIVISMSELVISFILKNGAGRNTK